MLFRPTKHKYPLAFQTPELQAEFHRMREEIPAPESGPLTLLVGGPTGGEGATTVAVNLAYAFAAGAGRRTLLLDANIRRPAMHRVFDLPLAGGLADWNLPAELPARQTSIAPRLFVVTAGEKHASTSWAACASSLHAAATAAAASFDVIIWDAPPLASTPEAIPLVRLAKRVVLVAESDETKLTALAYARDQVVAMGSTVAGVIINRRGRYLPRMFRARQS